MRPVRIASDWHLAPGSPPAHARLARAFLERAHDDGVDVLLNGDVFDDLFAGPGRSQAAHPDVVAALERLRRAGRLARTAGNHDPDAGAPRAVLEVPGVGRVLVMHGHAVDPVNGSVVGRLGDGISRRLGRLAVVRGAARLAEVAARRLAGERMASIFRSRCLAVVEREGFALGVFGHLHEAHLAPGDRYANAGALRDDALEYLELGPGGVRLGALHARELAAPRAGTAPRDPG